MQELRQPLDAEKDYAKAIQYLDGPDGNKADPEERPSTRSVFLNHLTLIEIISLEL